VNTSFVLGIDIDIIIIYYIVYLFFLTELKGPRPLQGILIKLRKVGNR
jgi:hypothetical protein